MLDKRKKEVAQLLNNGGVIGFILCEKFIDSDRYKTYEDTDLAKFHLNHHHFYRKNFGTRMVVNIKPKRNEFIDFTKRFGAAYTYFDNLNDNIDLKVIAEFNNKPVSFVLGDNQFFVSALIPDNLPERIEEYFKCLADGIVSTRHKINYEIPLWINDRFIFIGELELLKNKEELIGELKKIEDSLNKFQSFKGILFFGDDALVDSVVIVLREGFGLKIDDKDENKEDVKILDDDDQPIIFVEIKGTNKGVKREYINQADSHRERAELPHDFPSALIINPHMAASDLEAKDQEIPNEQIVHAGNSNILIVRTLDLLNLLKLFLDHKISREDILAVFINNSGWLKVDSERYEIINS